MSSDREHVEDTSLSHDCNGINSIMLALNLALDLTSTFDLTLEPKGTGALLTLLKLCDPQEPLLQHLLW